MKPAPPVTSETLLRSASPRRRGSSRTAFRVSARAASATARRSPPPSVQARDHGLRQSADVGAAGGEVDVDVEQHRDAGGRAGGGRNGNGGPFAVVAENLLQPRVRPAPVVDGRRVVDLRPVRREQEPAAWRDGAEELANRERRVVRVLEHLVAEDDVEAAVLDRERLDRSRAARPAGSRRGRLRRTTSRDGAKIGSYGFCPQPTSSSR